MSYIDPHIHMVSRTTDDYKRMALAGCVMVSEPAFWAGGSTGRDRRDSEITSASSRASKEPGETLSGSNTRPGSASMPRRRRMSLSREVIS